MQTKNTDIEMPVFLLHLGFSDRFQHVSDESVDLLVQVLRTTAPILFLNGCGGGSTPRSHLSFISMVVQTGENRKRPPAVTSCSARLGEGAGDCLPAPLCELTSWHQTGPNVSTAVLRNVNPGCSRWPSPSAVPIPSCPKMHRLPVTQRRSFCASFRRRPRNFGP